MINYYNNAKNLAINWDEKAAIVLADQDSEINEIIVKRFVRLFEGGKAAKHRSLILTFNNRTAEDIETKVRKNVTCPEKLEMKLYVETIYDFCDSILRYRGYDYGFDEELTLLTEDKDIAVVLEQVLSDLHLTINKNTNVPYTADQLVYEIKFLLQNYCLSEADVDNALTKRFDNLKIKKEVLETLKVIYFEYLKFMTSHNMADNDMTVLYTYKFFQDEPQYLDLYGAVYRYIYISEFEELTAAQYKLLTIFIEYNKNYFALINNTKLASKNNEDHFSHLCDFQERFNPVVFQLNENSLAPSKIATNISDLFPHNNIEGEEDIPLIVENTTFASQNISDAHSSSLEISSQDASGSKITQKSRPSLNNAIQAYLNKDSVASGEKKAEKFVTDEETTRESFIVEQFATDRDELNYLAHTIRQIKKDYPHESIGIITRTNRFAVKICNYLFQQEEVKDLNIKFIEGEINFDSPYVRWILAMLKLAHYSTNIDYLKEVLATFGESFEQIVDIDIVKAEAGSDNKDLLGGFYRISKKCYEQILAANPSLNLDFDFPKSIALNLVERRNFRQFIADSFIWCENYIKNCVKEKIREEALAEFIYDRQRWNAKEAVLEEHYIKDELILSYYLKEFIMPQFRYIAPEIIQILTVNTVKSSLFDHVFMVGMVDGEFPTFRVLAAKTKYPMQWERFRCAHAMSRAKVCLYFTYAERYNNQVKPRSKFLEAMLNK